MMNRLLKYLSRTVHNEEEEKHMEVEEYKWDKVVEEEGISEEWKRLTVWRKSLCVGCKGFTVINSDGNLVYRVDYYPRNLRPNPIILMDASGNSILSISRRKEKLGLKENWLVYKGEEEEDGDSCNSTSTSTTKSILNQQQQAICCARKHNNILQPNNGNILARLYDYGHGGSKSCQYVIEGSYCLRSCMVFHHQSRRVVAEIRKKEAMIQGISFGLDVFVLIVRPGFNTGLAMGIVLLLDQMFS